jgi:hypothetical protein
MCVAHFRHLAYSLVLIECVEKDCDRPFVCHRNGVAGVFSRWSNGGSEVMMRVDAHCPPRGACVWSSSTFPACINPADAALDDPPLHISDDCRPACNRRFRANMTPSTAGSTAGEPQAKLSAARGCVTRMVSRAYTASARAMPALALSLSLSRTHNNSWVFCTHTSRGIRRYGG